MAAIGAAKASAPIRLRAITNVIPCWVLGLMPRFNAGVLSA
jgi:hypothetical protein